MINAVAVLIVACPCALGLITPMSIMVASDAAAIENLRRVHTLTVGRPTLTTVIATAGVSEDQVLRLAACLDQASEHPLAVAIVRAAP